MIIITARIPSRITLRIVKPRERLLPDRGTAARVVRGAVRGFCWTWFSQGLDALEGPNPVDGGGLNPLDGGDPNVGAPLPGGPIGVWRRDPI